MYVPRWVIHVALGLAALGLGWFAQNAAAAESASSFIPGVESGTGLSPAAGSEGAAVADDGVSAGSPVTGTGNGQVRRHNAEPGAVDGAGLGVYDLAIPRLSSAAATSDDSVAFLEALPSVQLISPVALFGAGRTVDIAGYEDHSINVSGRRQFVVYDDSNLFVNRDGKINANTGDTDSAGLNAVDTVRSYVASGPHCDDGCDDESIISAQQGHFDEADGGGSDDDDSDDDNGEDDDEVEELTAATALAATRRSTAKLASASGVASRFAATDPPETCEEADTCGGSTDPVANGGISIGGDGWDDLAVRLSGEDNIIVTDDSNVALGGTGDVNAQIGDSDTGGTVTMHTVDSIVRGGISR